MMSKFNILVLSLYGLVSVCVGQYVQNGQCNPNVDLVQNFEIDQFLGTWYEIARTESPTQNGECSTIDLARNETVINITSRTVNSNFEEEASGNVTYVAGSAILSLNISSFDGPRNISILMADADNFFVGFICENITTTQRRVYLWQFGRNTTFPNEMIPALIQTTINNVFGINTNELRAIDHSDGACYVLPVIEPGQPITLSGQCDTNITVVQNFDVAKFTGVWHQISSYHSENALGTCARAEYTLGANGVNVLNSQVINRNLDTISGLATVASTDGSANLTVVLNISPTVTATQQLLIIATDYDNYAISYTCQNLPNDQKRVLSWILSRTRQLPPSAEVQVNQVVDSIIDLNDRYYTQTNQTDAGCFYYPEPADDRPVIFRGQCSSNNVTAMPNFDPVRYQGLWHDIESFPTAFQGGDCINALYTLVDGTVDVLNTQVINETLDTISATAVLASTDGSAILNVTFPVAGTNLNVSTNYWILDTDYDSYALVYSCTNLDADRMQVNSWKLSRTKELIPTAIIAINNITSAVMVLDQRYFVSTNQSTTGCFYYPEPLPGVPVVFPGQCNDSISAVANFDFNQFQGVWYEIQAYPKVEQTGQCVNHQFTFVNSSRLNLTSSSIDDQFNATTQSIVNFASSDGTARLNITISVNGTNIDIPYWVLSTDYTDYALAYACVNISQDYRGVYSWKLSRNKELSTTANTTIENVISNITVLDNRYYENVSQSDQACFYLPELAPGEPIVLPGQCDPNIPVVQNFNPTRYLGRWNLIESYPSPESQRGTCNIATYSLAANGSVIVYNTEVVDQALNSITGNAVVAGTDGRGILNVTFPSTNNNFTYYVLGTDYDNYALVYGCVNVSADQRRVWSWKLSRTNTLSDTANNAINQVVNSIDVLNNRYYQTINRTAEDCFYYPVPDNTQSVTFRGRCNDSIPVVTNFDAVRYMGLWHDIESYPMPFQGGSCPNANYSLVGGIVDVYNTQVINETLDTITGIAALITTDGSAKLNVTFNVGGFDVTTNYWVLATDYDNYAFVYSCQSIDEEYIQVFSWKLSRTKTLPTTASTTITNIINTIPVLNQRYYVNRDQSVGGCFYYPEPLPGVPVVFPGQCNNSISAIPNFNSTAFQGTWYELEAYPKEFQPGECVSHEFTVGAINTTLSLDSFSVANQSLGATNGTVTVTSTDGTGRLLITINSNGSVITIPYWILNTDYENYALAYSCVNIDSDYRAVYSWKLGRTKQALSQAANLAINNTIADINVLNNTYYEPVSQTDESCFYLPELNPGEPVIFVGQCDPNINTVTNFNAARYLGRWNLIESYASPESQRGTCNIATYSLAANGSVIVYNTEVVDQGLNSITGNAVVAGTDGRGILNVTFPSTNNNFTYYVLDTDYDNYALVYGCVNVSADQRRVWSWKLSRTNTLSETSNNAINQVVNSIEVLNDRYYESINRTAEDCFYYPVPDNSQSVTFRGRCNDSIPVVANFDAVRYMGLWHDIESYPMPFQDGSCPNANYSLVGGIVDVYNTQVINETLDTITGIAALITTDGSAKLNVTFNVGGFDVTTNYWVLATDYDNYAFVYSCQSIDEEYIQVFSWKLSRTKTLPTTAATTITNIVNTIPVLDRRYYVNRDQSVDGCFYYPEPLPGVPVVFPGQCNNSISAIPNFNSTAFQGTWYELEAYPKEFQPGECVSHEFTVGAVNTTLYLDSFSVANQDLGATNSTVTATSTDGTGRLVITINSNGSVITIPYWILNTDYENYALAYSCVNIDNDHRAVYSWKLGRTKQALSAAANISIANTIADINVLNNTYYEPVSQTDESCFYLPELNPGEPVIFVGQCDPNIRTVTNFNAARYLGQWYLIETYPSNFQNGDCNDALYTLGSDGSVIVYNTEVVNQTLATINGSAVAALDGSGKLTVTFPDAPPIEYWILDTDYETYTLVYSCANITSDQRQVWAWKMSRTNSLNQNANTAINQVINTINVLDNRYFEVVNRTDESCFYYPTPGDSVVRFRGQCNESIPVVTNFDAARYAGFWYDLESYPAPFQNGTCSNADYTLNPNGVVDVVNTQVINQVQEAWIGTAVLASTDGSAKLNVTFNVFGVDVYSDYWVLATDYDNYALVYSCRNVDENYREVYSWKLSRQPTLSPTSVTNINNAIQNVQVLEQQYYITRGQTEEDCFYYPDNFGCDVILDGQCLADSLVPAVTNFDLFGFTGTWHEAARFPSDLQNGDCAATEIEISGNYTYGVRQSIVFNERLDTTSIAQYNVSGDERGIISANISGVPFSSIAILATDYNNYALAYACRNFANNTKQIYSWKLSRSRSGLSDEANAIIDEVVSNNIDLWEGYYQTTDQTNDGCFYYPVFDSPPSSIILPGPCNENIRGVSNFNAEAYLGTWVEIEKYPQPTQFGTCDRAEYILDQASGLVNVSNTLVFNQTLETQLGTAVVSSSDGSGVLSVTFDVGGATLIANYYILATDYSNYALVYNCRNLVNGSSQVGSWKLSRSTSLSPQANTVIDNVITNTRGLLSEYYQTTSQTDEDCFYIPEVDPNAAPLFRGECEDITGVPNFDVQRYLGWWHEIERYPSDGNVGECISSQYEASGSSYLVVDTSVSNGVGTVVNGTVVTVTSDGRLRKAMSDGRVEDIWVLATDYTTYSLLYSCVRANTEYRRVWSAKHSKTRSLSDAAQNAMTPVIESNRVLYPQFYQPVDQSDQACFFYPEQTGSQVVIPGQCDENIGVVENFSADEYAGTWYAIEKYDSVQSTCIGARYVVDQTTGNFDVLSFEVIDGVLSATEGSANITSTDGSARLSLTFPVAGTNTTVIRQVSILATDYESYALAYSCVNVNTYQRAISAWKLSRTRSLPAGGSTVINNLIQQRQELHQPYFKEVSQSDDCEEPSSSYLIRSSIIVILVCVMLQLLA